MTKKCSRCGDIKDVSEFNKSAKVEYDKQYRKHNKERIAEYKRVWNKNNKEKVAKMCKQYRENNKGTIAKRYKQYLNSNKENLYKRNKQYRMSNAKYELFFRELTVDEAPRLHNDGVSLEVKCRYCGKYFVPTYSSVNVRVKTLNGFFTGDNYLYCSDNCKTACPVYRMRKLPKGFKKASSREVNSLVRQMCFKRDDWECQVCGNSIEEAQLHCHHIEGYARNPVMGNDIENVITLCEKCHKEVHKLPDCNYYELRCENDE